MRELKNAKKLELWYLFMAGVFKYLMLFSPDCAKVTIEEIPRNLSNLKIHVKIEIRVMTFFLRNFSALIYEFKRFFKIPEGEFLFS